VPRGWPGRVVLGAFLLLSCLACSGGSGSSVVGNPGESQGVLPLTPFAPPGLPSPFPTVVPEPTEEPELTPIPQPTPLPPPTPFIPLDQLRRTPTPSTVVAGHGMRLPPGFNMAVYATGLDSASYMALGPGDVLYVSLPQRGAVVAVSDPGMQGKPERLIVFAQGLAHPTGLAVHDGYLYVAEAHQVSRYRCSPGQLSAGGDPEVLLSLPAGPGLDNHPIGFGPDGMLYVGVGASCNACREADYRRATIMRYRPDGYGEEIFAQGLRDVEDLIWYPNTLQLLATNCGRRRLGDDSPPDTIEYVYAGANFGWPFCHAASIPDPELGWPEACNGVPKPFQELPAHTTPRGLCVYTGNRFPPEYYGDIFVALSGSWERSVPVGYKIVRLNVEGGEVVGVEDFVSGWLAYDQAWGRPVDLLEYPDGSLLVSDDRNGAIYRIYYER